MKTKRFFLFFLVVLLGLVSPVSAKHSKKEDTLMIYCGAGLKYIFEEIGQRYTDQTGTRLEFNFNGSGALQTQIKTIKQGDIFIPGERSFVDQLKDVKGKNYIFKDQMLFTNVPVIIISKDCNKDIDSLEDLAQKNLKVAFGDKSIAIGKLGKKILERENLYEKVSSNFVATFTTVNQVVNAIELGQAEAGIVFYLNYIDANHDKVKLLRINSDKNITQDIPISILSFSQKKELAEDFLAFVQEKGQDVFHKYIYPDRKKVL